jgi:hypothetical protein
MLIRNFLSPSFSNKHRSLYHRQSAIATTKAAKIKNRDYKVRAASRLAVIERYGQVIA